MQLFHTSPREISSIDDSGRYGEFLFFSNHVHVTVAGEYVTYSLDLDRSDIINASSIFYHEDAEKLEDLVAELADRLDIDIDTAEDLISEKVNVFDLDSIEAEDMGEVSWDIQHFTARAAKLLGFRGVAVSDEQGTAYMIDMLGYESALKIEFDNDQFDAEPSLEDQLLSQETSRLHSDELSLDTQLQAQEVHGSAVNQPRHNVAEGEQLDEPGMH